MTGPWSHRPERRHPQRHPGRSGPATRTFVSRDRPISARRATALGEVQLCGVVLIDQGSWHRSACALLAVIAGSDARRGASRSPLSRRELLVRAVYGGARSAPPTAAPCTVERTAKEAASLATSHQRSAVRIPDHPCTTQRGHDRPRSNAKQGPALLRWTPDSGATVRIKGRPQAEREAEAGDGAELVEATAKPDIPVTALWGDVRRQTHEARVTSLGPGGDDRGNEGDVRISVQRPLRLNGGDIEGDGRLDDGTVQIFIDLIRDTRSGYGHHATFWISLGGGGCGSTRTATSAIDGSGQ